MKGMLAMKHPFSEDQVMILASNPYTLFVNSDMIKFTVDFKRYLLKEIGKPEVTIKKAFANAGYDPEILGDERISSVVRRIRREASSAKGLHETGVLKPKLAEEDLSKKHMKTAIRELQDEVVKLQQQVDFLKKILLLYSEDSDQR